MGQVWFNVKTGEVFEQTVHRRVTKDMLADDAWVYLFTKDHRWRPHGWAVDYAWCDRCQRYHYVYNSYDGNIYNIDLNYIDLLDKTHDCKVAELVYEVEARKDSQYYDLLELIEVLGVDGSNVDEYISMIKRFMTLPRRKRRKLLEKDREDILAYLVSLCL